ncbi:hypothetical protein [Streptomyces fuscigenes]|uniref:hypothetical protein n=1 Tax=Streptomyces fuscigenes TaxID=1528880 RepID=UPI001F2B1319|nr:hypothetical protein [Streptomyces fuscigenes]MCF3960299.1 hypothetical protein [Streptomyces fuscigenes]
MSDITPADVTRPGVTTWKDGSMTWAVERAGVMGVIYDEKGMKRGRWAVWSPNASRPGGILTFTDDVEEAVDALLATLPAKASTVAETAGATVADVLDEAANLTADWVGRGRRAVFQTPPQDGDAVLTGPAVTVIRETLAARTEGTATPPAEPTPGQPEWRTLKGLAAPFFLYGFERGGHWHPAGDRKQVTGQPLRITRVWMSRGLRHAEDETGRELSLFGAAGKYWTAPLA